jgi:hypothetical protein
MPGMYDAGSVSRSETTTVVIDVTVPSEYTDAVSTEFVIKVNGFPIKRMNRHQAERMGLTAKRDEYKASYS